ncbi:MAG TPA: pantoate--beta-alanine ligase [Candidatus Binatia bacterium]|jgi:pantoate--beta-alanine ligase|nr:pantoate--beta-alanine ligase [Candidatus Binatia bacterium]
MRIVRSVAAMQRLARGWRRQGVRVGFVPTMGFLHAGHMRLVSRARQLVRRRGKVVISIYVNPAQFAPTEDFSQYPRDLAGDARQCRAQGVDVIFAPGDAEMYPLNQAGGFSTYVTEAALSRGMEGAARPSHFRGVTTVVAKLFNIVQPEFAVFGAKDYQQAAIIKRMVRDLNFPLKIVVAPTLRESDGLAMSSRNKYLGGDLRAQALVLRRSIQRVQAALGRETRALPAARLKAQLKTFIEREPAARLDYVEFFDPATLVPRRQVRHGDHMALAVFIGKTRLIDNAAL